MCITSPKNVPVTKNKLKFSNCIRVFLKCEFSDPTKVWLDAEMIQISVNVVKLEL